MQLASSQSPAASSRPGQWGGRWAGPRRGVRPGVEALGRSFFSLSPPPRSAPAGTPHRGIPPPRAVRLRAAFSEGFFPSVAYVGTAPEEGPALRDGGWKG